MMMNALAFKYLPNDELRRIVPDSYTGMPNTVNAYHSPETQRQQGYNGNHQSPTDLSLTSYRYLEKYGLLK